MLFIVTVTNPNGARPPHPKVRGRCFMSNDCDDTLGKHHSFLVDAEDLDRAREIVETTYHVTRVERAFFYESDQGEPADLYLGYRAWAG